MSKRPVVSADPNAPSQARIPLPEMYDSVYSVVNDGNFLNGCEMTIRLLLRGVHVLFKSIVL